MEQMIRVAKKLRRDHGFRGYIHLKTIPEASPWLIEQAGLWADRLSINLELPTEESLERLAPEKDGASIQGAMGQMHERIAEAKEERRRFSPAGQSTQVIVGADATTDDGRAAHQRARSTAATTSGGSTTRPSARSRTRARSCP